MRSGAGRGAVRRERGGRRRRHALAAAVALDHDDAAKIVAALLDAGADPTRADVRGVVPTQLAAAGGKVEALKLLLARGAGVNTGSVFSTPLHDAAFMGKVKCLRVLLENGADVSARDWDGRTAADRARGGDATRLASSCWSSTARPTSPCWSDGRRARRSARVHRILSRVS